MREKHTGNSILSRRKTSTAGFNKYSQNVMAWDVRQEGYFDLGPPSLGTQRQFPLVNKPRVPLAVRASVRFPDLKVEYSRTYEATREFCATDELWNALLHRLQHSCEELITRKDRHALDAYSPASAKTLKYEVHFHLTRLSGSEERLFRSYQKHPATMDQARDVILATDRMVGPFLKRHDKAFRWTEGPVREHFPAQPELALPNLAGPQSLLCVPRCRFVEAAQDYEFVPGYEVSLVFRSTCSSRRPRVFSKALRIASRGCVPLGLELGEDVLRRAAKSLDHLLDSRRRIAYGDRRSENGAVTVDLRVRNNLGPDYDHLCHSIRSKQALFVQSDAADCLEFLEDARHDFVQIVGEADQSLGREKELEIHVSDFHGPRWEMGGPFTIYLDKTVHYSQRSIGAVLERVQAGIADLLHGHALSIDLSARYRGHLVLDKSLVAHEDAAVLAREPRRNHDQEKHYFVSKLKQGIWTDVTAVCKDTCEPRCKAQCLSNLHISPGSSLSRSDTDSLPQSQRAKEKAPERDYFVTPRNKRYSPAHLSHDSIGTNMSSLASSSAGRSHVFSKSGRADDTDSTPPSTPSLMEGEGETPRDSLLITPPGLGRGSADDAVAGGIQIADDELNDTVARDFAYLGQHVEPGSRRLGPETASHRLQSKLQGLYKGPDTPTPVRNIVALPEIESVDEVIHAAPSKRDVDSEPDLVGADAKSPAEEATKPAPEPIMEGNLEYHCEPLDKEEGAAHDGVEEKPVQQGSTDDDGSGKARVAVSDKPEDILPLEGMLWYHCEEIKDGDPSSQEDAVSVYLEHGQHDAEGQKQHDDARVVGSDNCTVPESSSLAETVHSNNGAGDGDAEDSGQDHARIDTSACDPVNEAKTSTNEMSAEAADDEAPEAAGLPPPPAVTDIKLAEDSVAQSALDQEREPLEPCPESRNGAGLKEPVEIGDALDESLADSAEDLRQDDANQEPLPDSPAANPEPVAEEVPVQATEQAEEPESGINVKRPLEETPQEPETLHGPETGKIPTPMPPQPPVGSDSAAEGLVGSEGQVDGTEGGEIDRRIETPAQEPETTKVETLVPSQSPTGSGSVADGSVAPEGQVEGREEDGEVDLFVEAPTQASEITETETPVPPQPPVAEIKNPFDGFSEDGAKPLAIDDAALTSELLPAPILPTPQPKEEHPPSEDAAHSDSDIDSRPASCPSNSNALIARPLPMLPGFRPYSSPLLDSAGSSPVLRPRSAIPFGRPSHLRNHSLSTASHLGLYDDHYMSMPLGDVLFGCRSRPPSSCNSPALRPATAHGLLPAAPNTEALTMEEPSEEAEQAKARKKKESRSKKSKKDDVGGHRVLNSMMMFAAGVAMASSMVRRR